jgi:hypothetical protein
LLRRNEIGAFGLDEHLEHWRREFRRYHRDDKGTGKIVKRDDHLMDDPLPGRKRPGADGRAEDASATLPGAGQPAWTEWVDELLQTGR